MDELLPCFDAYFLPPPRLLSRTPAGGGGEGDAADRPRGAGDAARDPPALLRRRCGEAASADAGASARPRPAGGGETAALARRRCLLPAAGFGCFAEAFSESLFANSE